MAQRVLVATRSFGSTSPKPWDVLAEAGVEVVKADMNIEMTEARLAELLSDVDGAIIGVVPMTAGVLQSAPRLKVVSMHGVGVDHVDLAAAAKLGIVIANCPGTNDQAVADLTLGLMITIARNIPQVDRQLRQGGWGRHSGNELWNKTLGLIGMGRIGHGVAKRALGFDMQVLVYDPYVRQEQIDLPGVRLTSLEEVIKEADFLSLHAVLNDETRKLMNLDRFQMMKRSAYLVNTARGGLIDEPALHQALTTGLIAGAALDVYVDEPPVGSPLLELENVVLTPHIGAHTKEAIERMGVIAAKNVIQALQGGQPLYRV
jgi:D-3-phosphoglycerate dehydrogenase